MSKLDTCTIKGLSDGLPFKAYTLRQASADWVDAPRPYTVSVGIATSLSACR